MKNIFLLLLLSLVAISFNSCVDDAEPLAAPAPANDLKMDQDPGTIVETPELHGALLNHIQHQTEDYSHPVREIVTRPDGTVETVYVVSDDIELTKAQLEMYQSFTPEDEKQYRTNNRVTKKKIRVLGSTGGSDGLNLAQRNGLRWAVDNYNRLGLTIELELFFGEKSFWTNFAYDIVVYRDVSSSSAGGRAGFPYASGNPYKWVRIYTGMDNKTSNQNEHVIGHEIGHCLGLRHTDYFDRSTCGQNSNEGQGTSGARHIPGTPWGYDNASQMNACWPSNTNGEFSYYDRVALRWLF